MLCVPCAGALQNFSDTARHRLFLQELNNNHIKLPYHLRTFLMIYPLLLKNVCFSTLTVQETEESPIVFTGESCVFLQQCHLTHKNCIFSWRSVRKEIIIYRVPEFPVACEGEGGGTQFRRLDRNSYPL
jgi:hypothetical protein